MTGPTARPSGDAGFRRFLRPYAARLSTSVALSLAGTALTLARPWPLKFAIDHAIGHQSLTGPLAVLADLSASQLAGVAAAATVALVALLGVVDFLTRYLIGSTSELIAADMRHELFARLQRLSLRFHDRNRTGDLVNRLTSDVYRVQDALVAWFDSLIPQALTLVGMIVVVLLVDPTLALVALTVVPLLGVVVAITRRQLRSAQRETRTLYGKLASRGTEILRNVRVVQAFAREDEEDARFAGDSRATARAAVRAVRIESRYSPTTDFVLAIGTGLVVWLGVVQVTRGTLTVGTLLVVLSYVSGLYSPVRSLARLGSVLAKGAASRERLDEIMATEEAVPEDEDAIDAPATVSPLAVRHVRFSYREGVPALQDVSLEVAAGQTVCIVGANGAGKSTLLCLLLRLYDPDSGHIELGGVDLRRLRIQSLRERIALVPQDPWILDGTIADNIAFGRPGATEQEVRWAAGVALVDEFVNRLPEGFDTAVGEGGLMLSGGQRRRLALARAVVRGAPLLILDEPTAGLDANAERVVLNALRSVSRGRTIVIVSHATSVAAVADRVIVLDGGRVVEDGRRADLLGRRARGFYARLWGADGSHETRALRLRNGHREPSLSERR